MLDVPSATAIVLDISKWDTEDDPVTRDQVAVLERILDGDVDDEALEGFLIVSGRFVDTFGAQRTDKLAEIFRTETPVTRVAAAQPRPRV